MKDLKIDSPLLISSNAIRALTTALIIAREINYPENKILICPELYEAEISDYKNVIQSCNEQFNNILVFGHNPGISKTISRLSGKEVGEISTACIYHLTDESTKWQDVFSIKATIRNIYSPKLLSGEGH